MVRRSRAAHSGLRVRLIDATLLKSGYQEATFGVLLRLSNNDPSENLSLRPQRPRRYRVQALNMVLARGGSVSLPARKGIFQISSVECQELLVGLSDAFKVALKPVQILYKTGSKIIGLPFHARGDMYMYLYFHI